MEQKIPVSLKKVGESVVEWFRAHGRKAIFFLLALAALALSFEAGFLAGRERQATPLLIEKPAESCADAAPENVQQKSESSVENQAEPKTNSAVVSPNGAGASSVGGEQAIKNCAFVGSKNSNKYHLPKCTWAKRIKPENLVCFSSAADAESKGYQPGCVK